MNSSNREQDKTMMRYEIANIIADVCENSKIFVVKNLQSYGISDLDILQLYSRLENEDSSFTHGGVYCTAWYHAVQMVIDPLASSSLLTMGEKVWIFLDRQPNVGHRESDDIDACMKKVLDMGIVSPFKSVREQADLLLRDFGRGGYAYIYY